MMNLVDYVIIKEKFLCTENMPFDPMRIENNSINDLINNLKKIDINILKRYSEKKVKYAMKVDEGKTYTRDPIIPLETHIPLKHEVTRYFLRDGKGIELIIKNYNTDSEIETSSKDEYTDGDYGIQCKLTVPCASNDGDFSIVTNIEDTLRKTYQNKK